MKGIVTAFLVLIPIVTHAQQGDVRYLEATKIEMDLPPEMAHMAEEMPTAQTSTKQLLFTETASLMRDAPADSDEEGGFEVQSDNVHLKVAVAKNDSEYFVDYESGEVVEKRNFMGRTFRISGGESLRWRLTGEQSEFLGYLCQKAVATQDSTEITAWFTPEIPVPTGPAGYNGLPGLVLVVDIDDGQRTYTAQDVNLADVDTSLIVPPTKGRKVSRDEFDQIVDEKMKEMGAVNSGRGFKIIVNN